MLRSIGKQSSDTSNPLSNLYVTVILPVRLSANLLLLFVTLPGQQVVTVCALENSSVINDVLTLLASDH